MLEKLVAELPYLFLSAFSGIILVNSVEVFPGPDGSTITIFFPRRLISGGKGRLLYAVYKICQWRMGDGAPEDAEPMEAGEEVEAITCCLKHLIDSVKTWRGERGYLNYVRKFRKNAERQER